MTSVLGTNDRALDPTTVAWVRDLGIDFLIDRKIAVLLEPVTSIRGDKFLAKAVADSHDEAALFAQLQRHWRVLADKLRRRGLGSEAARLSGLLPADPLRPTSTALALTPWFEELAALALATCDTKYSPRINMGSLVFKITTHLSVLALARHGLRRLLDPQAPVLLAAPLLPAPGRVASGRGPIDVFEIAEPSHPFCYQGHVDVRAALGPLADQVRWHWLHGATNENLHAWDACCVFEAALEQDPDGLWRHGLPFMRQVLALRLGDHAAALRALRWPADPARALARAKADDLQARVRRDTAFLDAVGVPEIRPAFVVGRRVFAGRDAYPALAAELAHRLSAP